MAKYKLEMSFIQSTDGEVDDSVVAVEHSEDLALHLIKTQVWTKHMTAALNAITQELTDMALGASKGPKK